MTRKNLNADELAKAGVYVEVPNIVVPEHASIETVADTDIAELARDEAFMHEKLKIRVSTTTDVNAPPFARVTVNDITNRVDIPRGVVVHVKRLHVEVLARMRETRYRQYQNSMDPEAGNNLHPVHAQVYPFEIIEDKNPRGREWFERLMSEPTY